MLPLIQTGWRRWPQWPGLASKTPAQVAPQGLQAPWSPYEALKDHLCFYAGRVDACFVDGERVVPQEGDFYGGWRSADIVGPFKGGPGTRGW